MTYDVYRYIFYGGLILAIIMCIVSVILFIVLKIPVVIGDLSGKTARKAIADIQNQSIHTGEREYTTNSGTIVKRNLEQKPSGALGNKFKTEKISTLKLAARETTSETTVLETANETTVLSNAGETTVLDNMQGGNETTVLSPDMLGGNIEIADFVIEYEITYIHTQEVIV